ncbi:MAG: tetratricopeptide repeat protein [Acidobacteria bacterium]|nr:tetratricopeptide repeat protein [Acidobacteriota bacterium]
MTGRLAISAFLLLAGCAPRRPLPDLPAIEVNGMQPAVREVIEPAWNAALAKPRDAIAVAKFGMALHAHNQLAAAARAYERAALLDTANPDYSYYWGAALAGDGRYAESVEPLQASLRVKDSAPVRLRLADSLYSAGRAPEARAEYETIRKADANNAAALYGLGRCLQGAEAAQAFERAVQLFPRYGAARFALAAVYRQLGQKDKAAAALENYERDKLIEPPIDDPAMAAVQALDASATGLLRTSQSLERQGQLAGAAALQERALAADPRLSQAWINLISLYARLGQPGKAEAAYRKAIELEPNNAEAHYNFGVLCAESDRFAEAQRAFEAAVAADPANAEALDNLGAIVERSGAWDRAAALYRRAIAAKPGHRLAHYHLGRSLANRRLYPEAIREFEAAIEPADAQTPGYLYALGATYARAGQRAKAIGILGKAQAEATRWQQGQLAAAIEADLVKLGAGNRN